MKYKLIFFDLDGTLVDTLIDIMNSTNFMLNKFGLSKKTKEETRELIGGGALNLVKLCLKNTPYSIEEGLKLFVDYYEKHFCDYSQPYNYVKKTLEKLHNNQCIKKIVYTNKPLEISKKIIDKLELKKYFKEIIAPETFGVRKPDPLSVIETLKKFKFAPEDALIIGDSKADIEVSKNASISSIAVTYGYGNYEDIKNADYIIDSFEKIIEILN